MLKKNFRNLISLFVHLSLDGFEVIVVNGRVDVPLSGEEVETRTLNGTAVVDEPLELDHFGREVEVDGQKLDRARMTMTL